MRFLAPFMIICFFSVSSASAENAPSFVSKFKSMILDDPIEKPLLNPVRPTTAQAIISECVDVLPYDHTPLMARIGAKARHMANNLAPTQESLSFQPYFSGLKGPKLTIMRQDLERSLLTKHGSTAEIFHNSHFENTSSKPCNRTLKTSWDLELNHHIDLFDSNHAPLMRSDAITNTHVHFGGYFLGTASLRQRLYNNLSDDPNSLSTNRPDPIRKDLFGFANMKTSLNRLMLSSFATPVNDLYVAGHAGYLEEMFFGVGGEFLYRPYKSSLSIGGELWGTQKRIPYLGNIFGVEESQKHTSALLNLNYDVPQHPYSLGLSAGRFLDGDHGIEARVRYKLAQGWRIEGVTALSNQSDTGLNKTNDINLFAGVKITMPLGQFKYIPDNSRQTFDFKPFARDKAQRIDNPYPLYDLTDPWQAKEIHKYWRHVAHD